MPELRIEIDLRRPGSKLEVLSWARWMAVREAWGLTFGHT